MTKGTKLNWIMAVALLPAFALNLMFGAVDIPVSDVFNIMFGKANCNEAWKYIILQTRLPQAITAILCGSSLAVSGLLLQTAFRNPLAGPSIFGINSGASLGAALVLLAFGGSMTLGGVPLTGFFAVIIAAFIGSAAVMAILLLFARMVKNDVMLLIIGIMIGYVASSAISLLNFFSTNEGVHSYMVWGLGNFGGVSMKQIPVFSAITIIGLTCSLLLIKPLNVLLLGGQYATNLGINTTRLRNQLLLITGLLTASATAFCGPIAFMGLAVPHIARLILNTDNHKQLIPATIIAGALTALACNLVSVMPGEKGIIPLNAITPIIGAPVIIYVITRRKA